MNKPKFRRQEWFRYKKLGTKWRKARGKTSKTRRYEGRKPAMPTVGYRTPRKTRGLHPSGYQDVLISNPKELGVKILN
jgi:large subunit ribosomal protein L32e